MPSTRAPFATLVGHLRLNGGLLSLVAQPGRRVHGHGYRLVLCVCMLTAGCSNLLKADFQSYTPGAPPAGLPPGSAAQVSTLLPGAPAGDSLGISGHGGGTYNIVIATPPAGNKGLEIGGVAAGGVCLSSSATFVTVPLTRSNFESRSLLCGTSRVRVRAISPSKYLARYRVRTPTRQAGVFCCTLQSAMANSQSCFRVRKGRRATFRLSQRRQAASSRSLSVLTSVPTAGLPASSCRPTSRGQRVCRHRPCLSYGANFAPISTS